MKLYIIIEMPIKVLGNIKIFVSSSKAADIPKPNFIKFFAIKIKNRYE